jgi:(4S)-4-hydroxy-5-phosphonooxypentane-2,3-dione isomerase
LAPLVIHVEFTIKPESLARFRELMLANARSSLRDEPGCRRFDVLHSAEEPARVVLYEIYEDDAAFDHHLTTPHFKSFAAATDALIETRQVRRLGFLDSALNLDAERKTAGIAAR